MCDYKDQSAISDFDARKTSPVFLYTQNNLLAYQAHTNRTYVATIGNPLPLRANKIST